MRSTPGHAAARAEAWRTLRRPLVPEPYQPGGPIIDPASQAWVKNTPATAGKRTEVEHEGGECRSRNEDEPCGVIAPTASDSRPEPEYYHAGLRERGVFERTTKFDSASILVTRLYAGMSLSRLEEEGRRPEGGAMLQTPFSAELFPSARQKSATGKFSTPMSAELSPGATKSQSSRIS